MRVLCMALVLSALLAPSLSLVLDLAVSRSSFSSSPYSILARFGFLAGGRAQINLTLSLSHISNVATASNATSSSIPSASSAHAQLIVCERRLFESLAAQSTMFCREEAAVAQRCEHAFPLQVPSNQSATLGQLVRVTEPTSLLFILLNCEHSSFEGSFRAHLLNPPPASELSSGLSAAPTVTLLFSLAWGLLSLLLVANILYARLRLGVSFPLFHLFVGSIVAAALASLSGRYYFTALQRDGTALWLEVTHLSLRVLERALNSLVLVLIALGWGITRDSLTRAEKFSVPLFVAVVAAVHFGFFLELESFPLFYILVLAVLWKAMFSALSSQIRSLTAHEAYLQSQLSRWLPLAHVDDEEENDISNDNIPNSDNAATPSNPEDPEPEPIDNSEEPRANSEDETAALLPEKEILEGEELITLNSENDPKKGKADSDRSDSSSASEAPSITIRSVPATPRVNSDADELPMRELDEEEAAERAAAARRAKASAEAVAPVTLKLSLLKGAQAGLVVYVFIEAIRVVISHYVLPDLQWMAILLQQLFAFTIALHFAWFLRMRSEVRPMDESNPSPASTLTLGPLNSESAAESAPALFVIQNPPTLFHRAAAPKVASKVPQALRHAAQLLAEEDESTKALTVHAPAAQVGLRRRWEVLLAHLPASIAHTPSREDDSDDDGDTDF